MGIDFVTQFFLETVGKQPILGVQQSVLSKRGLHLIGIITKRTGIDQYQIKVGPLLAFRGPVGKFR